MAEKANGMMKKKDFFGWFSILGALVYGLYLLDAYGKSSFAPLSAFQMLDQREDRTEQKVDLLLLNSGIKIPPDLMRIQNRPSPVQPQAPGP